jgi:hypothetical protein
MNAARTRTAILLAALLSGVGLLSGCTSAAGEPEGGAPTTAAASPAPGPSSTVESPAASPAPSVEVLPPSAAPADPDLPDIWPAELPSYVGGQLSTVTISDDGAAINATWSDDASRQDAFDAMASALVSSGYRPTSETGGEDMLIVTDELITNDFTGPDFDVNVTVVTVGDQATVMLNASRR